MAEFSNNAIPRYSLLPIARGEEYAACLSEAYPALFSSFYPARLQWLFPQSVTEYPVHICEIGGVIAAWVWSMKVPVFAGDVVFQDAAFCINTFTLERYRGSGLGTQLQEKHAQAHQMVWSISMSAGNRRNRERLRWKNGTPCYHLCGRVGKIDGILWTAPLLDYCRRHKSRVLEFVVKTFLNCGGRALLTLWGGYLFRKIKDFNVPSITFESIERYDEKWNAIWEKIRSRYQFGVNRNSAYMNWNYVEQPAVSFFKYLIYKDGECIGSVVFRKASPREGQFGLITDILLVPGIAAGIYSEVVAFAVSTLKKVGCQYIYIATAQIGELQLLEKLHFVRITTMRPMYHLAPQVPQGLVQALSSDNWLLSLGDQDMAQYLPGRHPSVISFILRIFRIK